MRTYTKARVVSSSKIVVYGIMFSRRKSLGNIFVPMWNELVVPVFVLPIGSRIAVPWVVEGVHVKAWRRTSRFYDEQ